MSSGNYAGTDDMNITATNVFRIEGLENYHAKYRLHRVKGLLPDQEDFHRNLNLLCNRLARELRTPATFLLGDAPFVVLREDAPEPQPHYQLVRAVAVLEKVPDLFTLDLGNLTAETRAIALRFLQFALQGAFWRHHDLWQPSTGAAFFEKRAAVVGQSIGIHRGFLARVMDLGAQGFGLCVDVRHKYVSKRPLPAALSRKEFAHRHKAHHAIYHYGHEWYEIQLSEINDLTVTEYPITQDGKSLSLLEYVQVHSAKPLPPELANLPKDCAVVHYFNSRDQQMAAPSTLCFPVFDTSAPQVRREHGRTLLAPHVRRRMIEEFTASYLSQLRLDGQSFRLSPRSVEIPKQHFEVPDFRFGGNKMLSAKGTAGAIRVSLEELGKTRLALLSDKDTGFFTATPFQRQFFFVPESIRQSWGPQFLKDLSDAVDNLYEVETKYEPIVVPYNDSRGPTWVDQGQAIVASAGEHGARGGFAVVMLHEPGQRRARQEDQLAAYVLRRLWENFDIRAAVMHTETGSEAYELKSRMGAELRYAVRPDKRGKLEGYLRNVALNKVLLTNEKWPFVLAEPLHANVTIGVDLKAHHVGFTLIGQCGAYIETLTKKARFAEHLRPEEFEKHLFEILRSYHERTGDYASTVVIHRDGRMFESELAGARAGLQRLVSEGFVAPTASLTCVEIGKQSYASLRLFDVKRETNGRSDFVRNPLVGQYFIPSPTEGYLVATGFPFDRQGTVLPLHVRKVDGPMPLVELLKDVYRLTTLTWTRPEDCTRYPITIKLNDRRLFEDAGQYDESEMELQEQETTI
ncbi:MAG: hypothetical protein HYY24_00710 [Verrucomicrobia bacterium]|nr:hypothetical protein [Verrucomicrobiota bacterium]